MSDSGAAFFYANKPNRNAAFHILNHMDENATLDAEIGGDQSARLCPTPAVLDSSYSSDQKLNPVNQEPASTLNPIENPRTYPARPEPLTGPFNS